VAGINDTVHQRLWRWGNSNRTQVVFVIILLIGIFARIWEFRTLPPGLHHDEAAIGMEAYYLYHYGVDRNNISYPIHFIGWGNGQNAPHAYLIIPFIALLGLSISVIRLPILLSGIATLPFIYLIFKRTVDEKFGLFAMFCIAISPWHILLSRWGLESNLLPFIFTVGYFFLLKTKDDWRWFIPANVIFAVCLYTYGTTYAFLPIFLFFAIGILLRSGTLTISQVIIGLLIVATLGLPVILFVLINIFGLDSIHLGPITIPHMPTLSRFQGEGAMFQSNPLKVIYSYLLGLLNLLISQNDFRIRNVMPAYGYFYRFTFPLAVLGVWAALRTIKERRVEKLLLIAWLGAAFILGMLEPVIVNRINIIFIPVIILIAYSIYWLSSSFRIVMPVAIAVLLIAFSFFTYDYHGKAYKLEAGKEFYTGLLSAIKYAQSQGDNMPICITTYKMYQPYIFVLYTERTPPSEYLGSIHYVDPANPLREVDQLGRYTFGLDNCADDPKSSYVLFFKEKPDHPKWYVSKRFDSYVVYAPKP